MAHVPGEEARRSTLAAAKRGTGELGRDRNREGAQPCQRRERKRESRKGQRNTECYRAQFSCLGTATLILETCYIAELSKDFYS